MHLREDKWFAAKDSQSVVGRVVEVEKEHPAKSREAGKSVKIWVPAMAAKVLKDSADVSIQEIKPHNREAICGRFPGSWEYYQAQKGTAAEVETVVPDVDGMPIDRADFIPREKLIGLKLQGFSTVEQLASMSDEQVQSLGPGAKAWRKKAVQILDRKS